MDALVDSSRASLRLFSDSNCNYYNLQMRWLACRFGSRSYSLWRSVHNKWRINVGTGKCTERYCATLRPYRFV